MSIAITLKSCERGKFNMIPKYRAWDKMRKEMNYKVLTVETSLSVSEIR